MSIITYKMKAKKLLALFICTGLLISCTSTKDVVYYKPDKKTIKISFRNNLPDRPKINFFFIVNESQRRDSIIVWDAHFFGIKDSIKFEIPVIKLSISKYSQNRFELSDYNIGTTIPREISNEFVKHLSNGVELKQQNIIRSIENSTYLFEKLLKYAQIFYKPNGVNFANRISLYQKIIIPYDSTGANLYFAEAIELFRWNNEISWSIEYIKDSNSSGYYGYKKLENTSGLKVELGASQQYSEQANYFFENNFEKLKKVVYFPMINGEKSGCEVTMEIM